MPRASSKSASQPRPKAVSNAIEGWFPGVARALPWRTNRSGWRALVSELMLQQTQASRVAEMFEAFMGRFPTPKAMAEAGEDAVVAAWQGLGYYRRARLLYAASVVIVDEHGGRVPEEVEELEALPGVGRYTAGAVASIAHGKRAPIVDGNVARVIARLDEVDRAGDDPELRRHAWSRATELVEACTSPAILNEGLMELGASICLPNPRTPDCGSCPLRAVCRSGGSDSVGRIPRPKQRATRKVVVHHAVAIRRGDSWLLVRRPTTGTWAGMWELPSVERPRALADSKLAEALPFRVTNLQLVDTFTHLLSHREVRFRIYTAQSRVRRGEWRSWSEMADMGMSSAMRRAIERLAEGT